MPEPEDELPVPISKLAAQTLAQIVVDAGGPADPSILDRDIYREVVEATGIDPEQEQREE